MMVKYIFHDVCYHICQSLLAYVIKITLLTNKAIAFCNRDGITCLKKW